MRETPTTEGSSTLLHHTSIIQHPGFRKNFLSSETYERKTPDTLLHVKTFFHADEGQSPQLKKIFRADEEQLPQVKTFFYMEEEQKQQLKTFFYAEKEQLPQVKTFFYADEEQLPQLKTFFYAEEEQQPQVKTFLPQVFLLSQAYFVRRPATG